jgi:hypothetical protein
MRQPFAPFCARVGLLVMALVGGLANATSAQARVPSGFARSHDVQVGPRTATRAPSGRIAAQILVGAAAAAVVGFVAWSIVDDPEGPDRRVKGDAGYTPNANTAFAIGSFVGGAVASFLVGRADGSRGSFGATLLGAAVASIPSALGRHEPYLPLLGIVIGAPLQAIGATIGYQVTRRDP